MKTIEIKKMDKYSIMLNKFSDDLKSYINADVNQLITNGNIGVILQDLQGYRLDFNKNVMVSEDGKPKKYKMGKFDGLQVIIDPYMRWDYNKIVLKNDDKIVENIDIIDKEKLLF